VEDKLVLSPLCQAVISLQRAPPADAAEDAKGQEKVAEATGEERAAKKPKIEAGVCPRCSAEVTGREAVCFECGTANPSYSGVGGAYTAASSASPPRPGDWSCPGCKINVWARKFACFNCGTAKPVTVITPGLSAAEHNRVLGEAFTQLAKLEPDRSRGSSYNKAAKVLKAHEAKILSGAEAKKLKGIGNAIADKIDQFLTTGKINKMEEYLGEGVVDDGEDTDEEPRWRPSRAAVPPSTAPAQPPPPVLTTPTAAAAEAKSPGSPPPPPAGMRLREDERQGPATPQSSPQKAAKRCRGECFKGMRVIVLPNGVPKPKVQIFERNVRDGGGELLSSKGSSDLSVTHACVAPGKPWGTVKAWLLAAKLRPDQIESIHVVTHAWISDSAAAGDGRKEGHYSVRPAEAEAQPKPLPSPGTMVSEEDGGTEDSDRTEGPRLTQYACQRETLRENPVNNGNQVLCDYLDKVIRMYDKTPTGEICLEHKPPAGQKNKLNNEHRVRGISYARALAVVRAFPCRITRGSDISQEHYISNAKGGRSHLKQTSVVPLIDEIRTTGQWKIMDEALARPEMAGGLALTRLFDVGGSIAYKWMRNHGIYNVEQLKARVAAGDVLDPALTEGIRKGIRYHDQIEARMSRDEVETLAGTIKEALVAIHPPPGPEGGGGFKFEICGGFRREQMSAIQQFKDVDILMTSDQFRWHEPNGGDIVLANGERACQDGTGLYERMVRQLIGMGLLVDVFKAGSQNNGQEEDAHMILHGMVRCGTPPHQYLRRLDLCFLPPEHWSFALLGWTGSKQFEKDIRTYAKSLTHNDNPFSWKGRSYDLKPGESWKLSQKCLRKTWGDKSDPKELKGGVETGDCLDSTVLTTEEEIFQFLHLDYLAPHQRCA